MGSAHSNFDAKMAYAPSKKPSPMEANIFTIRATPNREIESGVTTRGIATPNSNHEITTATARDAMDVTVDEAKDARHLPARYGGDDFVETYTWGKTNVHFPSAMASVGTHE